MEEPCKIEFDGEDEDKPINLPVYLRIKPLKDSEGSSLKVIDDTTVETNHDGRANKKATFTRVFQGHVGQQQVFDATTASLLQRFLDGANVMTFAYGVTSSGKTFTIMGSHSNPGLIPRTLERIFGHYRHKISTSMLAYKPVLFEGAQLLKPGEVSELRRTKTSLLSKMKSSKPGFAQYAFQNKTKDQKLRTDLHATIVSPADYCTVWISVYEIYNEVITDLLLSECNRSKRKPLTIGQDAKGRTFVKDLIQLPVRSAAEAYTLLQLAKQNLAKASTKLNDNSSRSHMVFNIKMVHWGGACAEPLVNHFVISDLAGSERQAKTGASGVTLKQASAINSSLLVLGRCLEALRKKDRGISAPFRDSKLTRILNPFFTLGGYVSLIICINPQMSLRDETLDTIRFSAIASEIVQDTIKPLERLRKLRRLTQTCAVEPGVHTEAADSDSVESWQDAVGFSSVHHGVRYLEIKASYFNDMARDILYAEKQLIANEEEIASLRIRLKEAETSKENIQSMYQDRMKEQRDKFLSLKSELKQFYEIEIRSLAEEIESYEQKYMKYRNGYAKVSAYLEEEVWPEISLFRERFGFLPEFPPKKGGDERGIKPENSIGYWQEKLREAEDNVQRSRKELLEKTHQLSELSQTCQDLKNTAVELHFDNTELRSRVDIQAARINEMEIKAQSMQVEYDEALNAQVTALQEQLRLAEEAKESLIAEHEIKINGLREEMATSMLQLNDSDLKGLDGFESSEGRTFAAAAENPKSAQFLLRASLQKLVGSLASFVEAAKTAGSSGEALESVESLQEELEDAFESSGTMSSELSELRFTKIADLLSELTGRMLSRELESIRSQSEQRHMFEKRIAETAEDNRSIKEINVQLRERLQEFQDSLFEKQSVIAAQASELEELRQRSVVDEVLKTKAGALEIENQKLRTRMANLRLVELADAHGRPHDQTLTANRRFLELEKTSEVSASSARSKVDDKSLDASGGEKRSKRKPKERRRLRQENDENSILDRTLTESIQDATPIRNFGKNQRRP